MSAMIDKCPHCEKTHCVDDVAFANVENYGSQIFDLPCIHCGKMIRVCIQRIAKLTSIKKSNKQPSESDF